MAWRLSYSRHSPIFGNRGKENWYEVNHVILVPRAYDPSGLRQESRALGARISGLRHR